MVTYTITAVIDWLRTKYQTSVPGIAWLAIVPLLSVFEDLHRKTLYIFSISIANLCIYLLAGTIWEVICNPAYVFPWS